MNPAQPSDLLERVAARGLEQRHSEQLEVSFEFFASALRELPLELRLVTKLVSGSANYTLVRLEIAGQPFDLETEYSRYWELDTHRLYHAGLALTPEITKLEDYSRERASARQQSSLKALLEQGSAVAAIAGLAIYGAERLLSGTEQTSPGATLWVSALLALLAALIIVHTLETRHTRWLTQLFPRTLEPVGSAMRKGFERWQAAALETTPLETKEST